MDKTQLLQFVTDLTAWGSALQRKQGWRIPYWETTDWEQYTVEWGLRVAKVYDAHGDLSPAHAFCLARTSVFRDLVDQTKSVNQTFPIPESYERAQEDVAWMHCLPKEAEDFVAAILSLPCELWDAAEYEWKKRKRKKLTTSAAGLAFLLGWSEKRVTSSINALHTHLDT